MVEPPLDLGLAEASGAGLVEPVEVAAHLGVEGGAAVGWQGAEGVADAGPGVDRFVRPAAGGFLEHDRAGVPPAGQPRGRVARRHREEPVHRLHRLVGLEGGRELSQRFLVVRFAPLHLLRLRHRPPDHGRQPVEQRLGFGHARRLHRMEELADHREPVVERDDLPLEDIAVLGGLGLGLRGQCLDPGTAGRDLRHRETFAFFRLLAEQGLHFLVLDQDRRPVAGVAAVEEHLGQPGVGPHLLALAQAARQVGVEPHEAPPAAFEQGVARHRVERLEPAAADHRDPAEGGEIRGVRRCARRQGGPDGGHHRHADRQPRQDKIGSLATDGGSLGGGGARLGGGRCSSFLPPRQMPGQAEAELHRQAGADQGRGEVGQDPDRIAHDLQDRGRVVVGETGLVEGVAAVAQRVVHPDADVAPAVEALLGQGDEAGEVLGGVGAGISVVLEVAQGQRERQVHAARAQGQVPLAPVGRGRALGRIQQDRHHPRAEAAAAFVQAHQGGRLVGPADGCRARQAAHDHPAPAHPLVGRQGLPPGRGLAFPSIELRVRHELDHLDAEGQARRRDLRPAVEPALRDGEVLLPPGIGHVDHGQLALARGLGVVGALAFGEGHPRLQRHQAGAQLAQQDHDDAEVHQHEARLRPAQAEPDQPGGQQVHQQQQADQVAARHPHPEDRHRRHQPAGGLVPAAAPAEVVVGEEPAEVDLHHLVDPEVDLVEGRPEDQPDRQRQQGHRQPRRREGPQQGVEGRVVWIRHTMYDLGGWLRAGGGWRGTRGSSPARLRSAGPRRGRARPRSSGPG